MAEVNLTNEQKQLFNSKKVEMTVTLFEANLLKAMREIKFGDITVYFLEGVPYRYTAGVSHMIDPTEDNDLIERAHE